MEIPRFDTTPEHMKVSDREQDSSPETEDFASKYEADSDGFIRVEDLVQGEFTQTAQYLMDFIDGNNGKPRLFDGLQFKGNPNNFGHIRIHASDAAAFVEKYRAHKDAQVKETMRQFEL